MSFKIQGDMCETAAIFYYTSKGYVVSKPITHSSYYDVLVDTGDKILRVECKSSSYVGANGNYVVSLVTSGGNQTVCREIKRINKDKTDIVFIMDGNNDLYEFQAHRLHGHKTVTVNKSLGQYVGNIFKPVDSLELFAS